VEGFRDIDGGSNSHDMIMAQVHIACIDTSQVSKSKPRLPNFMGCLAWTARRKSYWDSTALFDPKIDQAGAACYGNDA
jgi:hypothetical protein